MATLPVLIHVAAPALECVASSSFCDRQEGETTSLRAPERGFNLERWFLPLLLVAALIFAAVLMIMQEREKAAMRRSASRCRQRGRPQPAAIRSKLSSSIAPIITVYGATSA